MSDIPIVPIERLDLRFAPRPWRFADERRAEIDAHFAALRRDKPAVWNGRVLMLRDFATSDRTLRGAYFEVDYASFLACRDWGWPDRDVRNCFSLGALLSTDGAFLLGVMASHTANGGKIYFPGGTPDPRDVVDGMVDLAGSVRRELAEETGLSPDDVEPEPGWHMAIEGPRVAMLKVLRARAPAVELRERVLAHLAAESEPELADIRIVRGPADLDPMMPPFVPAFLAHMWR